MPWFQETGVTSKTLCWESLVCCWMAGATPPISIVQGVLYPTDRQLYLHEGISVYVTGLGRSGGQKSRSLKGYRSQKWSYLAHVQSPIEWLTLLRLEDSMIGTINHLPTLLQEAQGTIKSDISHTSPLSWHTVTGPVSHCQHSFKGAEYKSSSFKSTSTALGHTFLFTLI